MTKSFEEIQNQIDAEIDEAMASAQARQRENRQVYHDGGVPIDKFSQTDRNQGFQEEFTFNSVDNTKANQPLQKTNPEATNKTVETSTKKDEEDPIDWFLAHGVKEEEFTPIKKDSFEHVGHGLDEFGDDVSEQVIRSSTSRVYNTNEVGYGIKNPVTLNNLEEDEYSPFGKKLGKFIKPIGKVVSRIINKRNLFSAMDALSFTKRHWKPVFGALAVLAYVGLHYLPLIPYSTQPNFADYQKAKVTAPAENNQNASSNQSNASPEVILAASSSKNKANNPLNDNDPASGFSGDSHSANNNNGSVTEADKSNITNSLLTASVEQNADVWAKAGKTMNQPAKAGEMNPKIKALQDVINEGYTPNVPRNQVNPNQYDLVTSGSGTPAQNVAKKVADLNKFMDNTGLKPKGLGQQGLRSPADLAISDKELSKIYGILSGNGVDQPASASSAPASTETSVVTKTKSKFKP